MNKSQCIRIYEMAIKNMVNEGGVNLLERHFIDPIKNEGLSYPEIKLELNELMSDINNIDNDLVESGLVLAGLVGDPPNMVGILCNLLLSNSHNSHEDVAGHLQRLKDPRSVEYLFQAAQFTPDHLEWDEDKAFSRKCLWALGQINTHDAWSKIDILSKSLDPIIVKWACEQLEKCK